MTRLVFETKRMKVAELGEESSVPDLFGELTTQNSLVFDLDEDDEIYEGYGKVRFHIVSLMDIQESCMRKM